MTSPQHAARESAQSALRIVSLVPSLTELVCALGLFEHLVGRTGFCVHPREALRRVPKIGGTKDVRIDAVLALEPTHVLVNVDENLRETADTLARHGLEVVVTHPCTPEDNRALYRDFGARFGRVEAARALEAELDAALSDAAATAAALPVERVLYPIWREPWMTVTPDTYIAAMLERVGWRTLPEAAPRRYPEFAWDDAWLPAVQRVLLPSEPYRFRERHVGEIERLAARPVTLVDGEMVSWYGSRAIAGLRYLIALRKRLEVVREPGQVPDKVQSIR